MRSQPALGRALNIQGGLKSYWFALTNHGNKNEELAFFMHPYFMRRCLVAPRGARSAEYSQKRIADGERTSFSFILKIEHPESLKNKFRWLGRIRSKTASLLHGRGK
jgi:hypothetical protein